MTSLVESISSFIESTPTPKFIRKIEMDFDFYMGSGENDITLKSEAFDHIETCGEEMDINLIEKEDKTDLLLPSSFEDVAVGSFTQLHTGLAKDWNNYFIQVGDWLVAATEGADSHPESENEEEGKAGFAAAMGNMGSAIGGMAFNLSGVQARASSGAKNVGSFFTSAFGKASETVKVASTKLQVAVGQAPLLAEFNKEQEAFIKAKGGKGGEALPPWVGYPEEDKLKEEIMSLSTERRNFVRNPPTGVSFEFDLEQFLPVAQATLAADPELEKMRYELVPKTISEEVFWRNYFYRVGLIRQSQEISDLEKQEAQESQATNQEEETKDKDEDFEQFSASAQVTDAEFVSDAFQPKEGDNPQGSG